MIAAVLPGTGSATLDPFVALADDALTAPGVVLGGRDLRGVVAPASMVFPTSDVDSFAVYYRANFADVPGPLPLDGGAGCAAEVSRAAVIEVDDAEGAVRGRWGQIFRYASTGSPDPGVPRLFSGTG